MIIKLQAPRTANGYPLQLKIDTEKKTFSLGSCQFTGGYAMAKKSNLHELAKDLELNGYKRI
jgi:hypothetical protein